MRSFCERRSVSMKYINLVSLSLRCDFDGELIKSADGDIWPDDLIMQIESGIHQMENNNNIIGRWNE